MLENFLKLMTLTFTLSVSAKFWVLRPLQG